MKFSQNLIFDLTQQIGHEFSAMLQYVAIAAYFDNEALTELADFFYKQAEEEKEHAMKFVHYLVDAGVSVSIPAMPESKSSFQSAEEAISLSLQQEEIVTQQIHALVQKAKAESDYITENFLQWFVAEQLEEVSTMTSLLQVVRRAGPQALWQVEDYLARKQKRKTETSA